MAPPGFARGGDMGPLAVDYTDSGVPCLRSPLVHKRGVYWSIVYAVANAFRDDHSVCLEHAEYLESLSDLPRDVLDATARRLGYPDIEHHAEQLAKDLDVAAAVVFVNLLLPGMPPTYRQRVSHAYSTLDEALDSPVPAEALQRLFGEGAGADLPPLPEPSHEPTFVRALARLLPLVRLLGAPGTPLHPAILGAYTDTLLAEAHDSVAFTGSAAAPHRASRDPRVRPLLDGMARRLGHDDYSSHLAACPTVGPMIASSFQAGTTMA